MTREEKLYTMTGNTLLEVAEKLGLKVNKNILKQGKSKLIEKIMEAEKNQSHEEITPEQVKNEAVFTENAFTEQTYYHGFQEVPAEAPQEPVETAGTTEAVETKASRSDAPKRTNLKLTELTYKGETKSIKEWAAEINMPWPTLYDRVNRNGWPVDLAIETPLGQRRPKNETLA